ncbi:hypothetical protein AwDysgo_19100 [Bacteroidales bacterium]|nr:hypothetical protein AwDysgo_19100 [Bacteroidales bacterium]
MSKNEVSFEYDDDESVSFIQNYLPQELKAVFSDDEVNYIVDLIYEYYDGKGYLDELDDDKEILIDEQELVSFVVKQAQKDKVGRFEPEAIKFVVEAELAYGDSIDLFD